MDAKCTSGQLDPNSFTAAMLSVAKNVLPRRPEGAEADIPSQEQLRLHSLIQRARAAGDHRPSKRLVQALKRQRQKQEEAKWRQASREFRQAADRHDWRTFYKLLDRYTGSKSRSQVSIRDAEGVTRSANEAAYLFRSYFDNLLNRPAPTASALAPPFRPAYSCNREPPTLFEVRAAMATLRSGSAPGDDSIWPCYLKALPLSGLRQLTDLLRKVWLTREIPEEWKLATIHPLHKKGIRLDCCNYRGISMLSVLYKLLEKIIISRIAAHRELTTRAEQAGFRRGRSTVDHTQTLTTLIQEHARYGKPLYIAFLDFEAAFDAPDRDRVWALLEQDGVPRELAQLIIAMNTDTKAYVRRGKDKSSCFNIRTGVRQGSALGPFLFNYVVDAIMNSAVRGRTDGPMLFPSNRRLDDLDFADDVAILSTTIEGLQEVVSIVEGGGASFGLPLKAGKCKLMCGKGSPLPAEPLKVNGIEIETTDAFCYLGTNLTSDGKSDTEVAQRILKARSAFFRLRKLWISRVSDKVKFQVYNACVRSVLFYGSETWTLIKELADSLRV